MLSRLLRVVVWLLLVAFGVLSLHYTSAEDVEHHRAWAVEHRLPGLQPAITVAGWVVLAAGTLWTATAFRKPKRT